MKKICNPSLLSMNYFVLSSLLAKMSLYVSFFITSNKKYNLEGSYAFHKKPPRRSKIWEKNLLWILRAASSSYELPALPPPFPTCCNTCQGFYCSHGKNYVQHWIFWYYYLYYFIFLKLLTNLLLRRIIFENSFEKSLF